MSRGHRVDVDSKVCWSAVGNLVRLNIHEVVLQLVFLVLMRLRPVLFCTDTLPIFKWAMFRFLSCCYLEGLECFVEVLVRRRSSKGISGGRSLVAVIGEPSSVSKV